MKESHDNELQYTFEPGKNKSLFRNRKCYQQLPKSVIFTDFQANSKDLQEKGSQERFGDYLPITR